MIAELLARMSTAWGPETLPGHCARLPLNALRKRNGVVRILRGPGRGFRWLTASAGHNVWLGFYEPEMEVPFCRSLAPGAIFYDLGAYVGYWSLIASRLVGTGGTVIAFEPVPENLRVLRLHLQLNGVSNVTVVSKAVYDRSGAVKMAGSGTRANLFAHVSAEGELPVQAVALDDLVFGEQLPPPQVIKMDVEGSETHALRGALRTLMEHRPVLFLSTHSEALRDDCCRLLESIRYSSCVLQTRFIARPDELLCRPVGASERTVAPAPSLP